MSKFEEYLDKAKELAEDATDSARLVAGEVASRAKELTEEGGKARELVKNAKEQTAALSLGAREKVQGILTDARAVKEISLGLEELKALPEFEGSILYPMEHGAMINYLNNLMLIVSDNRIDNESVEVEIRKVMSKSQPAVVSEAVDAAEAGDTQAAEMHMTDEEKAIENAKIITYNACVRALAALGVSE